MAIVLLGYVAFQITSLQKRGRRHWLLAFGAITHWGMGWGGIAILNWAGLIDQQIINVWFMTHDPCLPCREAPTNTGPSPPPMILHSPWLSCLAQRWAGTIA